MREHFIVTDALAIVAAAHCLAVFFTSRFAIAAAMVTTGAASALLFFLGRRGSRGRVCFITFLLSRLLVDTQVLFRFLRSTFFFAGVVIVYDRAVVTDARFRTSRISCLAIRLAILTAIHLETCPFMFGGASARTDVRARSCDEQTKTNKWYIRPNTHPYRDNIVPNWMRKVQSTRTDPVKSFITGVQKSLRKRTV